MSPVTPLSSALQKLNSAKSDEPWLRKMHSKTLHAVPNQAREESVADTSSMEFIPYTPTIPPHGATVNAPDPTIIADQDIVLESSPTPHSAVHILSNHQLGALATVCIVFSAISVVVVLGIIIVRWSRRRFSRPSPTTPARQRIDLDDPNCIGTPTIVSYINDKPSNRTSVISTLSIETESDEFVVQRARTQSVEIKRGVLISIPSRGRVSPGPRDISGQ